MSSFGDMTAEDSHDPTAEADPEAVARIFVLIRHQLASDHPEWDHLHPWERALLVFVFAALLARLKREGSV